MGISPFNSPEKNYHQQIMTTDLLNFKKNYDNENYNASLKQSSGERSLRRSTSLLEPRNDFYGFNLTSLRNPENFFENKDKHLSSKWRGGEREYRRGFSVGRIQEFPNNTNTEYCNSNNVESNLFTDSISACDSSTNLQDSASSRSIISCESSAANSFSNIQDHSSSSSTLPYKSKSSRNFEIRLLAAESLIKASKFKNLDDTKFDKNTKFKNLEDTKFDSNAKFDSGNVNNKTPDDISEMVNSMISKRNRSIPFPRFRSSSLNREFSLDDSRRKSFTGSPAEKSLLQKFPKFQRHDEESSSNSNKDENDSTKIEKSQRRISRFLRPDFFDTPREESQYVKEKEAKKALENERRKSRFMRKPIENAFENENISNSITTIESHDIPNENQNTESKIIQQSLINVNEMEKCQPNDSALFTHYIPETTHETSINDESSINKKSSKTFSKSKTVPRIDVPCKEEVKTSESATNMRFRSKIPTKFKKNETNIVKKIADSNKLLHKNPTDLSSSSSSTSKVKKKENELSLLQRSKTEVKKSLEQCSKLVKKYSLDNTKKIKAEKEIGIIKSRTNSQEKEKSSERNLEKNSSRNIVQVEIVADRTTPEKKQNLFKSDKAFREESQSPNGENVSEENGKRIVKKILPSLSKINSTLKGNNNDKGEKKLLKRTKVKEVNEKENDNTTKKKEESIKKKEDNSIKRKEDKRKEIDNLTKKKETDKKKENEITIKKKEAEKKKKNILPIKKSTNNFPKTSEKINKQSSETSDDSEEKFDYKEKNFSTDKLLTRKLVNNLDEKSRKSNKSNSPINDNSSSAQKIDNMKIILDANNSFYKQRSNSSDDLETNDTSFYTNPEHHLKSKELSKSPDHSQCEGTEYFNLYGYYPSDCEMNNTNTRSDIANSSSSSALPVNSTPRDQESIIDRIRRKSFYSRFNDRKRKTLVSPLSSRTDMWPSMTLPKNFSFTSTKKNDSNKRYSLYNNILSDSKNIDRNRYSFCSSSADNSCPSIDSLQNNIDLPRRKYSSATDFSLNKNHFENNTIPRKKEINKFQIASNCDDETNGKNCEDWSCSSIASENCSNDFTMGIQDDLVQFRKKD